jgi:tight adherence protein C
MDFSFLDPAKLPALLAAFSAFSAVMVVCWPYLAPSDPSIRLRRLEGEKASIRIRERAKIARNTKVSLRTKPRKLYQTIVDRLDLARHAENGAIGVVLARAGYRGHSAVITYLAVRIIAPMAIFTVTFVYLLLVLKFPIPFMATAGIAACLGSLGYFAPSMFVRNRVAKRQQEIRKYWPDALDLLLITVESGMSIESAFRKVAHEIGGQSAVLAEEMSLATAEMSYLQDRRKAFENLGTRTGVEGVRSVVTSLIQTEKYGTPLGSALRVMAQENRDMRMNAAEKKAASLPPKLTVPMILFFLPVLFVVIVTPAAIQIAGIQ